MKKDEFERYYFEHRHNRRYIGIFLMFAVIAVVVGVLATFSVANMTGQGVFSFLQTSDASRTTTNMGGVDSISSSGNGVNCVDSDNGINIYGKGICRDFIGGYSDGCSNIGSLNEYSCSIDNICFVTSSSCPAGYSCSNGACVQQQNNQTNCTDSDGGIEPYIFGIVDPGDYKDFCWNNGTNVTNSSNVLAEFYCWDNKARRTLIYCPHGCANGECLVNVTSIVLGVIISDISLGHELEDMDIDPSKKSCQGGGWYRHTYATDTDCVDNCYSDAFSFCSSLSPDCWSKWQGCNGRFCKSACQYFGGDYRNSRI